MSGPGYSRATSEPNSAVASPPNVLVVPGTLVPPICHEQVPASSLVEKVG
jgi:hypothetical protein